MVCSVPLAQWIARWTSNPKVLGSTPRWDDRFLHFLQFFYLGIIDQLSEAYGFHSVAVITCASHAQGRRFEPGWKHQNFASSTTLIYHTHGGQAHKEVRSYGVMVSPLDFESSDPSSNLGRSIIFSPKNLSSLTINLRKFKFISRLIKTKCTCVSFRRSRPPVTFTRGLLIFRLFRLQRLRLHASRSLPLPSSTLLPSWL